MYIYTLKQPVAVENCTDIITHSQHTHTQTDVTGKGTSTILSQHLSRLKSMKTLFFPVASASQTETDAFYGDTYFINQSHGVVHIHVGTMVPYVSNSES